ncbi:MAG: DUF721 domain-containing protein [Bacteroidales bacterium]|nr:DUF721 domain-containing protein [Bacteroidales bacterium]
MAGLNRYYYLYNVKRSPRAEANELPLKDFLGVFFRRCHIDYNPYEEDIKEEWFKLTGLFIKKYTQNIYIKDSILFVKLSSSVAKAELSMVREAVKNKINRSFEKEVLKDIILL